MIRLIDWLLGVFARGPHSVIALLARLSIGMTFWNSGQTKLDGYLLCLPRLRCVHVNPFNLSDTTIPLFRDEYALPYVEPWLAAHSAALAEFVLPILLILGLGTRFAALGLLIMTIVIQTLAYPGAYVIHGMWAALLLLLIKYGPGKLSVDHWLARRY